jgi:hypothetical protein
MKKLMNRVLVALVGMVFILASCGKYDGGPGLSLATKKMRLTGTWDATSVEYADGSSQTIGPNTVVLTYEKDGTFKATYLGIELEPGTWEFNSDKTAITTVIGGNSDTTDPIYRLTGKDLWFKDADGDITKYSKK